MVVLGLTGSIGMGKSATAEMFRQEGIAVHDADAAVHALYGGAAAPLVETHFPGTTRGGTVDRTLLAQRVVGDPAAMARLEQIVHPLVQAVQSRFLAEAAAAGAAVVVLDIPLLFETGGDALTDAVVVVSAPKAVQEARVLARPGMTRQRMDAIVQKQMPDAEKRRRADFVVDTSRGFDEARKQVKEILRAAPAIKPKRRQAAP